MIIVNVVRDHWQNRATEWLMVYPAVFFGIVLLYQDDLFRKSPSFAQAAAWADQSTWALCVLLCALVRLIALTVNGTFKAFPYGREDLKETKNVVQQLALEVVRMRG